MALTRLHMTIVAILALAAAGAPLGAGLLPADVFAQTSAGLIDRLDPHNLPLGDGKVSAMPTTGSVYSCQQNFGNPQEGGAVADVPWIHGNHWDLTEKESVQGNITWPQASFTIARQGDRRVIAGNDLPISHATGQFPISPSDPAYQYDRNPNSIATQPLSLNLPANPALAATPTCVPMGLIGVALSGVAIFNALDAGGRDAVAHEVQDACSGHPQQEGMYHYHGPSRCLPGETARLTLVGYALDGFGIFSEYDAAGREVTDADLDECHGRTDAISWDGQLVTMYHYTLTREYPYTVGCLRGTPVTVPAGLTPRGGGSGGPRGGGPGGPGGPRRGPPPGNRPPPPSFPPGSSQGPPPDGLPPGP